MTDAPTTAWSASVQNAEATLRALRWVMGHVAWTVIGDGSAAWISTVDTGDEYVVPDDVLRTLLEVCE